MRSILKKQEGEIWDEWRKRASDWMFFDQVPVELRTFPANITVLTRIVWRHFPHSI